MTRIVLRAAVLLAAMGMGWAVARAQSAEPAFEIVVDAPAGATTITCVKGCTLAWVERGVNPNSKPMATFSYECRGAAVERCSSRKVGGWIAP
jgi:hypothetical protein